MKKSVFTLFIIMICFYSQLFSQGVVFNSIPADLQLFPRDNQDSSAIEITGKVTTTGYDSVILKMFKNNNLQNRKVLNLQYQGNEAPFSYLTKIHAEKSEYKFEFYLDDSLVVTKDSIVCGDAYLINGQSNALAIDYDGLATYQSEWLRSFGNSNTAGPIDTSWGRAQGHTAHTKYAVGVWGLRLGQLLVENNNIPVCILNGATSGSEISFHLRNDDNPSDQATNYGRLLYRTQKAGIQHNVKAILWNQGESDAATTVSSYDNNFARLYEDWKLDYSNLEMIYTFQIRPCTQGHKQSQLRNKQRLIAELYPDVDIMATVALPGHDGLHYHYEGYKMMGEWIYRLLARDFYNSADTLNIAPPHIQKIFYSSAMKDELAFIFDQDVLWPADTLGASLKDYFYLKNDTNNVVVDSGYVLNGDTVVLKLSGSSSADRIQYLPNNTYNGSFDIYEGPWLKNPRSVGALSFHNFPVSETSDIPVEEKLQPKTFVLYPNYPNPFNSTTRVNYSIYKLSWVKIEIFNVLGELISSPVNTQQNPGEYSIIFDAAGHPSGIYFFRLTVDNEQHGDKIILMK